MPECAECRIFTDQLNKEFGGQSLNNVEIVGGRFKKQPINKLNQLIFPLTNTQFKSKGKFLYWTFDEDDVFFITLGMAASFGPRSKHSAIKFTFDTGDIYFNDIRHFGTLKISDRIGLNIKLNSLGWDILEPTPPTILRSVRRFNNKTVAEVMMNQVVFAGCGNYLKSESCYKAKINPTRLVKSLSDEEIFRLCYCLQETVHKAYAVGGATIATFKDLYGNTGKFFDDFKVYGKKQDPLGNPIKRILTKDGRSTFYVETVQR